MDKQLKRFILILACTIALFLHILLLLFLWYYCPDFSDFSSGGMAGQMTEEPAVIFDTSQPTPSITAAQAEDTHVSEESVSQTAPEPPQVLLSPEAEIIEPLLTEETIPAAQSKSDHKMDVLPSRPPITHSAEQKTGVPTSKNVRRSLGERRAQWQKRAMPKAQETSVLDKSTPVASPFKNIVDVESRVIQKSSVPTQPHQQKIPSHAYDPRAQSLAFIYEMYNKKIGKKLSEHCSLFRKSTYTIENTPSCTVLVTCVWNKSGKLLDYRQLAPSTNPQIDKVIEEFFKSVKFPHIPPQLSDHFSVTYTIHVQAVKRGFADFTVTRY
ncbi:MAG: energy transducer TonB [Candidatus Babeliaceae bacterium]